MSPVAERPTVRGARGVVACGHPIAAGAALRVFAGGGGAVDAAIAAAAALSVVLPDACGLGGDAMALVRSDAGDVQAYNGSGAAPQGLRQPMPHEGGGTVAVPGAVAAWQDLHRDHGRLEFARVLAPAIALAEQGFPIGERLVGLLKAHEGRLSRWAKTWRLNKPLAAGDLVRQPELARTLERIASHGTEAFYEGELAEAVAAAVRRAGGDMTANDLHRHASAIGAPVETVLSGARLAVQPPVSQAILASLVLRTLESAKAENSAERTHATIELVEAAFAHRNDIASTDARHLLCVELAYDKNRAARRGGPRGYSHTAAVTTADAEGRVVSMLVSVFDDFGAAVSVPEGGFVLNNRLDGFLGDHEAPNSARGGARPVHTLSPALVDDDDHVFALATPGADGQVQSLVQLLNEIVSFGEPVARAISQPRWVSVEGKLVLEETFPPDLARNLENRGHDIVWAPAGAPLFGAACVAGVHKPSGTLFAAADPRRETSALAL